LGIVAHWISPQHLLQSTGLGMKHFRSRHTGENQARHFWDVVETYHLQEKIAYFTLDNASNNDTAMKCIQTYLQNCGIPFDPVTRRLRCFGHVINLVVKAVLQGEDPEAFEIEKTNYQALGKEKKELLAKCKKSLCGKLHNLLVYINWSPQRRDRFEENVKQLHPHSSLLRLIRGNETGYGGTTTQSLGLLNYGRPWKISCLQQFGGMRMEREWKPLIR